jgi:hypothetical protein
MAEIAQCVDEDLLREGVVAPLGDLAVDKLRGEELHRVVDAFDEGRAGDMVAVIVGRDEIAHALRVKVAHGILPMLGIRGADGAVDQYDALIGDDRGYIRPVVGGLDINALAQLLHAFSPEQKVIR